VTNQQRRKKKGKDSVLNQLAENLIEDLAKCSRGGKDEVYIENDFIVVRTPSDENFIVATEYLSPVINASMIAKQANRVAVKLTNGKDVHILSWGF